MGCVNRRQTWIVSRDAAVLVVDEAHRLKSGDKTQLFKALQNISARFKLLLTGTPVQNSLSELLNLLKFLDPAIALVRRG